MAYSVLPCSSQIITEMLPKIQTMEKLDFLKSISHSQIILFSVMYICILQYVCEANKDTFYFPLETVYVCVCVGGGGKGGI